MDFEKCRQAKVQGGQIFEMMKEIQKAESVSAMKCTLYKRV